MRRAFLGNVSACGVALVCACCGWVQLGDVPGTGADAGGQSVDAGADAPNLAAGDTGTGDGAIGLKSFCSSLSPQPLFCDDFDEAPFPSLWTNLRVDSGGDAGVSDATAVSLPNSAFFYMEPNPPPDGPFANVVAVDRDFGGPFIGSEHVAFDVLLTPDPTGGYAGYAILSVLLDNCGLALGPAPDGGSQLLENPGNDAIYHTVPGTIPTGKWVHVDLQLSNEPPSATVTLDGALLLATRLDPGCGGRSQIYVATGEFCADPCPTGLAMRIDNFVFDAK